MSFSGKLNDYLLLLLCTFTNIYEQQSFPHDFLIKQSYITVEKFCFDDDDEPEYSVVYCYELQVSSSFQGRGLGAYITSCLARIGRHWGLSKVVRSIAAPLFFFHSLFFSQCNFWSTNCCILLSILHLTDAYMPKEK